MQFTSTWVAYSFTRLAFNGDLPTMIGEEPNKDESRIEAAVPVLVVLVAMALLMQWHYAKPYAGIDFYNVWAVSDSIENERTADIYASGEGPRLSKYFREDAKSRPDAENYQAASQQTDSLRLPSTPFLISLMGLFSNGDYDRDLVRYRLFLMLCMVSSVLLIGHCIGLSAITSGTVLLGSLLLMEPWHSELRVANVNSIQLMMVALVIYLQTKSEDVRFQFAAGLVLALAIGFKPNLLIIAIVLLPAFILRRQWRKFVYASAGLCAGGLIGFAWSTWYFGSPSAWLQWLNPIQVMSTSPPLPALTGNFAFLTLFNTSSPRSASLLLAGFFCLLTWIIVWRSQSNRSRASEGVAGVRTALPNALEETILISCGCVYYLLAGFLVWEHYFLLALPLLLVSLGPLPGKLLSRPMNLLVGSLLPGLALAGLILTPLWWTFPYDVSLIYPIGHGIALLSLMACALVRISCLGQAVSST